MPEYDVTLGRLAAERMVRMLLARVGSLMLVQDGPDLEVHTMVATATAEEAERTPGAEFARLLRVLGVGSASNDDLRPQRHRGGFWPV